MAGDNFTVDLSNYRDLTGERVPPGRYTLVIEDVDHTKAGTGSVGIQVWFRIHGGEMDGSTLVERFYYQGPDGKPSGALFRLVGLMQAIGMPTPKKKLSLRPEQFIGKRLMADVDDGEPYNGRVSSEIRGFMRAGGNEDGGTQDAADLDLPSTEGEAPSEVDLEKLDLG